jgi:glyoxylase-like metal-dependent hydrolase (beta-lactamase superfamily II)
MRRAILLGVLMAAGVLTMTVAAFQQPPGGAPPAPRIVEIDKLKDNLYVMKGGGGNSSVFITASGVVVVDTKNPGWGQPLLDAIRKVTDRPVTTIINTHTHGDHVSGNVEFADNVEIIAHENTAANMKQMRPNSSAAPNPNPPNIFRDHNGKGLPKRTMTDRLTLGRGADQLDLMHWGRAHTNGDITVFFPAHRVLHVADMFPGKELPIMDSNNGGTGVGYADTLAKVLAFSEKGADVIVNGHSNTTTTNADLKDFIQFVRGYVKDVQSGKAAGRTVDQVAESWKPPAGYAAQPARVRANAQLVFTETR